MKLYHECVKYLREMTKLWLLTKEGKFLKDMGIDIARIKFEEYREFGTQTDGDTLADKEWADLTEEEKGICEKYRVTTRALMNQKENKSNLDKVHLKYNPFYEPQTLEEWIRDGIGAKKVETPDVVEASAQENIIAQPVSTQECGVNTVEEVSAV